MAQYEYGKKQGNHEYSGNNGHGNDRKAYGNDRKQNRNGYNEKSFSGGKYRFINPYNFIPFSNKAVDRTGAAEEETVSGVIEYSLLTKTPLFIPNTSNDDIFNCMIKKDKVEVKKDGDDYLKSYEFFSYEDLSHVLGNEGGHRPVAPVIPGSEIRGMFRTYYEILSNSCLPFLDDSQVLHKRVSGFFQPGLLIHEGDGYAVIAADVFQLRARDITGKVINPFLSSDEQKIQHFHVPDGWTEGQKVKGIKKSEKDQNDYYLVEQTASSNYQIGYVLIGEPGPVMPKNPIKEKRYAHVFVEKDCKGKKIKSLKSLKSLEDVLTIYQVNKDGAYKEYAKALAKFKKSNDCMLPVYYSNRIPGHIYLSPSCFTMQTYQKITDYVDENRKACRNRNNLCPACSLFGMVAKNAAVASKIRFSDLFCCSQEVSFAKPIVLQELSSPKLQNTEFYLKKPADDAVFWTYDYWIDSKQSFHSYTGKMPQLNGRKFYWHQPHVAEESKERTKRNIMIRPIEAGNSFKGRVFFEGISYTELNRLIQLINCFEQNSDVREQKHGYKLGMAKPLGYGSIAMAVNSVEIRKPLMNVEEKRVILSKTKYEMEDHPLDYVTAVTETFASDSSTAEAFEKMTRFTYISDVARNVKIEYPYASTSQEIFKWFVNNHVFGPAKSLNSMCVKEYMDAPNPLLQHTVDIQPVQSGNGNKS